ncbi:MAG: VOC family protein [Betaproteobacteria bacterium]|nr:VOC family protein [Betaproteobacteria bacterium]
MSSVANLQVPRAGELNLDHVAHFVPHLDSASGALETLGFTLTPFSEHSHRSEPGGPLAPSRAGRSRPPAPATAA